MTGLGMLRSYIRWMVRRDMSSILKIEAANPSPWSEEDFLRCLRQRNCIGMVVEVRGRVVGHMVYELHTHHLAVLNLAVHRRWRRLGLGRLMVEKLVSKLAPHRRRSLKADVPEANLAAHLWLRACGFTATGVLDKPGGAEYAFERVLTVDQVWSPE